MTRPLRWSFKVVLGTPYNSAALFMLIVPEVAHSIASVICSSDQTFLLAGLLGLVTMGLTAARRRRLQESGKYIIYHF